jgi:hypothetical protein
VEARKGWRRYDADETESNLSLIIISTFYGDRQI